MAIDPTIALGFKGPDPSQQINPLVAQSNAVQAANQLVGFQQNQQKLRAQQAIGQAQQAATDPTTGVVDQGKFRALVAGNPDAALGAQAADSTSMEQQGAGLSNEAAALRNQGQKIGFLAGLAAPLAADANVTKAKVQDTIQHAVNFGLVDASTAQQMLDSIPEDSAGVRQSLTGFLKAQMGPTPEYEHIYGAPASINQGSKIVSGTVGPADQGGGFSGSTATPLGLTPSELSSQQPGVGPNGQPTATPLAGRLGAQGMGNLVTPGGTQQLGPGGKPTVPPQWSQPGSGGYPNQQQVPTDFSGPGSDAGGGSQPATPIGPQSVAVGPPAGQVAAQTAQAQASAEAANTLMGVSANRNDRLGILGNMASDLTQFTSGPGYDRLRALQSTLNNYVPGLDWNGSGVEGAQSFNKFAQQLANAQSTALGAGSDAKLAASVHSNPNSALQGDTNKMVIHQLMGNEDAINAKAQAWKSSGLPAAQFQQWNQQFSQSFDPRAFQALRMSQPEQKTFMQGLKDSGQLDSFRANYNAMAASGLVPDGQSASGN